MTISQVFEYGKERGPEWYSDFMSGVESLDGTQDTLWITSGTNLYNPETDSYDSKPMDQFLPQVVKTSYFDQVTNGELTCEVKVFGSTNATVTYRTIRMPLYTTDQAFDVSVSGKKVGGLGIGRVSSTEVSVENAEALPETQSWNFTLDEAKLFATGSYTTETALEELPADYMILANEEKTIVLDVTRNASEGENGTMANDNAWASREYAAGETFDIYVMADGTVYTTGIEVTL